MKHKFLLHALLICGAAICLSGCGQQKPDSESAETTAAVTETTNGTTVTETTTTETTTTTSPNRNPLTGEADYPDAAVNQRPVAVMVNNLTGSLPQYGIEAADLIYELPVEGGITRLMAVYPNAASVPDVCSVRSCRYYYPLLCLGMDALYCHWGSDQTIAKETLERTGIDHFDGGMLFGTIFFRDPERQEIYSPEHTGYLAGEKLPAFFAEHGVRTELLPEYQKPLFDFADASEPVTPDAEPAPEITLHFSGGYFSTFQYDAAGGCYLKQHSGQPHIDGRTGNQLRFKNVIILQTDIHLREDEYRVDVALEGGSGFYVTNGAKEPITWQKTAETAPITLFHADGTPLTINTGKSYIGIIDMDCAVGE